MPAAVAAIFTAIGAGLTLMTNELNPDIERKRWVLKTQKRLIEIETEYHETKKGKLDQETGKVRIDQSVIDSLELELFMLCRTLGAAASGGPSMVPVS